MDHLAYCHSINELFRTIETKMSKLTNKKHSKQNLTVQQISILLLLDEKGIMRVSDIGKSLSMVDSNVSAICSRLEKIGFVERFRQKEDQRVVKVHLTAAAKDRMEEIKADVSEFQDLIFKNVSEDDLKDIVLGLAKYERLLDLALMQKKR